MTDKNLTSDDRQYLLIKRGYYYRPDNAGYTPNVFEAGLYTKQEMEQHIKHHDRLEPRTAEHISETLEKIKGESDYHEECLQTCRQKIEEFKNYFGEIK